MTLEMADAVESARLVATIITFCGEATATGAVYMPVEEIDPMAGLVDQRTVPFVEPDTVAANACACKG